MASRTVTIIWRKPEPYDTVVNSLNASTAGIYCIFSTAGGSNKLINIGKTTRAVNKRTVEHKSDRTKTGYSKSISYATVNEDNAGSDARDVLDTIESMLIFYLKPNKNDQKTRTFKPKITDLTLKSTGHRPKEIPSTLTCAQVDALYQKERNNQKPRRREPRDEAGLFDGQRAF